jgi:hypothetical protein
MIAYRLAAAPEEPRCWLRAIRRAAVAAAADRYDDAVELLVEAGGLETGVADALEGGDESPAHLLDALQRTTLAAAALFLRAWTGVGDPAEELRQALCRAIDAVPEAALPDRALRRTGEGYAYYALYPETYGLAAWRYAERFRPAEAVCIGIRTIGTSLSAVVTAALARTGMPALRATVRPRGHPYARTLALPPPVASCARTRRGADFLVIDEGPGRSGSSLAAVAEALSALGVPDERIHFFPSWEPAPEQLLSPVARERWVRHRRHVASFEDVWPRSRWDPLVPAGPIRARPPGSWREDAYADEADWPAVQPQHERRTFLWRPARRTAEEGERRLTFEGLGRHGRAAADRAAVLAEAAFTPPPLGLSQGFLATPRVAGVPLRAADADTAFLEHAARYLAFRAKRFPARRLTGLDALVEMAGTNVAEGLGPDWAAALDDAGLFTRDRVALEAAPATALDARLQPHEWLRTARGFVKTDALHHHDDHFFPGPCDVAWDVAGLEVEFDLGRDARAFFEDRCGGHLEDAGLGRRVPFYRIAYLAFRLGYARLAGGACGEREAERFRALEGRMAEHLRREIAAHALGRRSSPPL